MANPEHLEILKQGVKAWNKWRKENPSIEPDLMEAKLSGAILNGANLEHANLERANLESANLAADLMEAKLNGANLSNADLRGSSLVGAELRRANLSGANMFGVALVSAILEDANLSNANIEDGELSDADLGGANLSHAKLGSSVLERAKLIDAKLDDADLRAAMLYSATLYKASLKRANLKFASLTYCRLIKSDLTGAELTGAVLYGSSRDNWNITNVHCDYVYWDEMGEHRSPEDRDLQPGEFEQLYAALPTIEYIFENGMTPIDTVIMDRVVQAIREKKPEFDIKIDSINARGLAPSIKFTVQQEEYKEPAIEEVRKGYDERINRLETEKDRLYQLLGQAIDKAGDVKLITAGPGAIVATDGSTVNIQQHIYNTLELQKAIADEPEESENFVKVAKKTALDIVGEAMKDIAKGQVKEAAKQIVELGKDLGPIIAQTAAYTFFKSIIT